MSTKARDLRNPGEAGVFHLTGSPEAVGREAVDAGLAVFGMDLAAVDGKDALISGIARTLGFPPWFGQNWDALTDLLSDLSWLPADGWMIIFDRADALAQRRPEVFHTAIEVFLAASAYWREAGKPFWVLLNGPEDWKSGLKRFS